MRNTHYEVQIRKQQNGKYLVDLILWEKNGYGSVFGKYFGKSLNKAIKTANNTAELYCCKVREVK
tara:strand:- start:78 stop:272 length:195 start_codon:yes stop_codon:yes gene_type:complete